MLPGVRRGWCLSCTDKCCTRVSRCRGDIFAVFEAAMEIMGKGKDSGGSSTAAKTS